MSPRTRLILALLLGMGGLWYLSMAWDALSRPQEHPLRVVGIPADVAPPPPPPAPRRRAATKRKETQ